MSALHREDRRDVRFKLVSPGASPAKNRERNSDCWPDWGGTQPDAETRAFAQRNRPGIVFADIAIALMITGVFLLAVRLALNMLHAG